MKRWQYNRADRAGLRIGLGLGECHRLDVVNAKLFSWKASGNLMRFWDLEYMSGSPILLKTVWGLWLGGPSAPAR
jgi:hypothetical protein